MLVPTGPKVAPPRGMETMRLDDFFEPGYAALRYDALFAAFAWVRAMAATPQDPRYHAEGDVWIHTRMVCDALITEDAWPSLTAAERRLMLTAALLHDAGKPEVTFTDADGRIRSPEHALRGETIARRVLWQLEESFAFREHVAALVRNHLQPRYLPEQRSPLRRLFAISYTTRCDLLALLARADTRGRITEDYSLSLKRIGQFTDLAYRYDCLTHPRAFTSDHARFLYFRHALDDPAAVVDNPAGPTIIVMSGLPASGKNTWIARQLTELPVIALDDIRVELGIPPTAPQEPVVQLAHARVAALLAQQQDLIWNATTLGKRHRTTLIDLAASWDPRIRIVHVDAPPSLLFPRNRARPPHAVVPDDVIERMTCIWQPPDLTEAHEMEVITAQQSV
jgi:predicted kinase